MKALIVDDEPLARERMAALLADIDGIEIAGEAGNGRDALEAIELRGMTQKEAAERAGISLTAMKARVQRARRRLKSALLECCEFVLDARGGVLDCASRARSGRACHGTSDGKECHDA